MVVALSQSMTVSGSAVATASPWYQLDPSGGDVTLYVTRGDKAHRYKIEKTLQNPRNVASPTAIQHVDVTASTRNSALSTNYRIRAPIYGFRYTTTGVVSASASTLSIIALQGDFPYQSVKPSSSILVDGGGGVTISNSDAATSVTKTTNTDTTELFTIPEGAFDEDGDEVELVVGGSFLNNTGATKYIVETLTLGGTLISDPQTSGFSAATAGAPAKSFEYVWRITRTSSTTGRLAVHFVVSNSGAANAAVSGTQYGGLGGAGKAHVGTYNFALNPEQDNAIVATIKLESASTDLAVAILYRHLKKL